jgi:hypothetical protein
MAVKRAAVSLRQRHDSIRSEQSGRMRMSVLATLLTLDSR